MQSSNQSPHSNMILVLLLQQHLIFYAKTAISFEHLQTRVPQRLEDEDKKLIHKIITDYQCETTL